MADFKVLISSFRFKKILLVNETFSKINLEKIAFESGWKKTFESDYDQALTRLDATQNDPQK